MKTEKLKEIIKESLEEFFQSEKGEEILGNIILKAAYQSMQRDMTWEDGTSEPGRIIEKTGNVNLLDRLIYYLPRLEGAIRGCQSDAAEARNRAAETRDLIIEAIEMSSNKNNILDIKRMKRIE